jgi:hypothetical protein
LTLVLTSEPTNGPPGFTAEFFINPSSAKNLITTAGVKNFVLLDSLYCSLVEIHLLSTILEFKREKLESEPHRWASTGSF